MGPLDRRRLKFVHPRGVKKTNKDRQGALSVVISAVALSVALVSCTHYAGGLPSDEEQGDFQAKMSHVEPGMSEQDFLALFPVLKSNETRKYGIVDVQRYQSNGYDSRTYWLGFIYVDYNVARVKQVVSVRCTNEVVGDIYWP